MLNETWQELFFRYSNHWLQRSWKWRIYQQKRSSPPSSFYPPFVSVSVHSSIHLCLSNPVFWMTQWRCDGRPSSLPHVKDALKPCCLLRIHVLHHLNVRDPTWQARCTAGKNDLSVLFKFLRVRTSYLKHTNLYLLP